MQRAGGRGGNRRPLRALRAHVAGDVRGRAAGRRRNPQSLKQVQGAGLPWRAAVENGALIGYAYATPYRARSAYRYTLENSVYVSPDHLRGGIGSALMRDLIDEVRASGLPADARRDRRQRERVFDTAARAPGLRR